MTAEAILQLVLTALIGIIVFLTKRSVGDVDKQLTTVATDVRQLAAQGARHGESLAAGVQQFKAVEKRLDKLEEKQDQFQADCIACRVDHTR